MVCESSFDTGGPTGGPTREPAGRGDVVYLDDTITHTAKILIVGPFAVGKTSFIGAASEIRPLCTEEPLTERSVGVDDLSLLPGKHSTTVAMDFGRITMSSSLALYMFGTPGQKRFWDMWAGLAVGAVGVVVLVDTRRLGDSFEVLDQIENHIRAPFIVAVNHFADTPDHPSEHIRRALDLPPHVPIVDCCAVDRASAIVTLERLVEHAITARGWKGPTR